MLLINRTYETVTPESAEDGEAAERGFLAENKPVTFRELVDMLRGGELSSWPSDGSTHDWVSLYETDHDYRTGASTNEAVHFSRDNPPHCGKYWRKALRAAGYKLA